MAVAVVLSSTSIAGAQATTGHELWLFGGGIADLTRRLELGLEQQVRLDESATGFNQTFTELSLRYRVARPFRVGGFYRLIVLDGETRHRVGVDGEALARIDRVRFGYRLRLQHTTRDQSARTALRNRVKIAVDAPHRLTPFVSAELFYVFEKSELREQRFSLGLDWAATKKIELTAFYLYQREINVNAPERSHVLGLGLTWTVRALKRARKPRE